MKYLIRILTKLSFLVALSSCSTSSTGIHLFDDSVVVEQAFRGTNFIRPESNGGFLRGDLSVGYMGGNYVQLIRDIDSTPYKASNRLSTGGEFGSQIGLGIINRLDLIATDLGTGVRVQFWGPTRRKSKKGDYSAGVAYLVLDPVDEVESEDTTGSVKNANAKAFGRGEQFLISAGYKISDNELIYGGPFYTELKLKRVELYQTNNTDFTFSDNVNGGHGSSYGLSVGYYKHSPEKLFQKLGVSLSVEAAYSHTTWKKTWPPAQSSVQKDGIHLGSLVGVTW